MFDIGNCSLLVLKLLHLQLESLIHLLASSLFESKFLFKLFDETFLLCESFTNHGVDFHLCLAVLKQAMHCALGIGFVLLMQLSQVRCFPSAFRGWVVDGFDLVLITWLIDRSDLNLSCLSPPLHLYRRLARQRNVWCVPHFVIEHSIVGLLRVTCKLVDVLINLKCGGCDSCPILKLNVEFAGLFSKGFHLYGVTRILEDSGCVGWHATLFLVLTSLLCLHCSLFSNVDIHIEVLACICTIIPPTAVERLGLVLGANFFLQLIDTLLILASLLLVISQLPRGTSFR